MTDKWNSSVDFNSLKVAIVHEWFVDYSGSERVVEQMLQLFPQADLYAQVEFLPNDLRDFIRNKKVTTSFIQKLPFARTKYRTYLPLMPLAVEQFDMSDYDLILSSSHAVAKGVITGPDQIHICYCHSPMRYAWDLTHQYLRESGLNRGLRGWIAKLMLHYIRQWDSRSANSVDEFIANSNFIARRIWKTYRRKAVVINPPVDTNDFKLCAEKDNYYLTVSRFVPYKKIDLIVNAFTKMPSRKLIVIGEGPDFNKINVRAGSNITFLGYQPGGILKDYMQRARAFVFAAEEDFGIVPVEAQACGTPVIAYGKGGSLETILNNETGVFFYEQKVDSIVEAVNRFEKMGRFNHKYIRENSLRFSVERFRSQFKEYVEKTIQAHKGQRNDLTGEFPFISGVINRCENSVGIENIISNKT